MNDWESVKEVQAMCGSLDFVHIYAQRKMTFISKIIRLNNNVLKACYVNFCESHECITLYSKFDITTGASVDKIRDTVFNNFYSNVAAR